VKNPEDNDFYASYECNCDWEGEHGLCIVLKNGLAITRVGKFDGHLTNTRTGLGSNDRVY
jgi:hypothetical protein